MNKIFIGLLTIVYICIMTGCSQAPGNSNGNSSGNISTSCNVSSGSSSSSSVNFNCNFIKVAGGWVHSLALKNNGTL